MLQKSITIIMGIVVFGILPQLAFASAAFSDVGSYHLYHDAIGYVSTEGIVKGYSDGTYRPQTPINRAEFTKIVVEANFADELRSRDIRRIGMNGCFPDVKGQWFAVYVCLAKSKGIISGHPDGLFRPDQPVSFVEVAKILTLVFDKEAREDRDIWYRPYVEQLEEKGAIPLTVEAFRQSINRGEMAEMVYRLRAGIDELESRTYSVLEEARQYYDSRREWREMVLGDRVAEVRPLPFREDMGCVQYIPGGDVCPAYGGGEMSMDSKTMPSPACDPQNAPVCGVDGKLYSNACWAKHFGVKVQHEGFCREVKEFVSDIWLTRKINEDHFVVPEPYVSFREQGGKRMKNGTYFRSTVWEDNRNWSILNFDVLTDRDPGRMSADVLGRQEASAHPLSGTQKTLIVYVMYGDLYPEELLHAWTKEYGAFLNKYLLSKQHTQNPVQYDITSVVIDPPPSVKEVPMGSIQVGVDAEFEIAEAAFHKTGAGSKDFTVFVPIFVYIGDLPAFPGNHVRWHNHISGSMMESSASYLGLDKPPDFSDPASSLSAQIEFQRMFYIVTHETLHEFGWANDHMPDDVDENLMTFECGLAGDRENYFAAEIQGAGKIRVGEEPLWLYEAAPPEEKNCRMFRTEKSMAFLKDTDLDGEYEMIYANNSVSDSLAEDFGWRDIDGDGVAEIEDSEPYGGLVTLEQLELGEEYLSPSNHLLSEAQVLGYKTVSDCRFVRVNLIEVDREGLVPLECDEFNYAIVNIYEKVRYYWRVIERDYGSVFLPALH